MLDFQIGGEAVRQANNLFDFMNCRAIETPGKLDVRQDAWIALFN